MPRKRRLVTPPPPPAADPDRALVFSYGSNLWTPQLLRRCPDAALVEPATLHDWALAWAGWSKSWGGAVATVRPVRGARALGAVAALTRADLAALDAAEGEGLVYQRLPVAVELRSGGRVDAWVYVHKGAIARAGRGPSPRYVARIAAGLAGNGWGLEALDRALGEPPVVRLH